MDHADKLKQARQTSTRPAKTTQATKISKVTKDWYV